MKYYILFIILLSGNIYSYSQSKSTGIVLQSQNKQTAYLNIGLTSKLDSLCGFSFNLLTSMGRSKSMNGVSIAGLGHFSHYSGLYNGVNVGGLANMAPDGVNGVQISGMINSAGEISGLQLSGLVNFTDDLKGVQIAPFNVCGDCKGVQIGLVNSYLGEKIDVFQLGLINFNRSTKMQVTMFGGSSSLINTGIRFKGERFYNMFSMGAYSLHLDKNFSWNLTYRSGIWLPLNRLFELSGDLGYQHLMTGRNRSAVISSTLYALQTRLNLECKLTHKMSIFFSGGYEVIRYYGRSRTHSHQPVLEGGIILF